MDTKEIKVSVVIPVHNTEKYIRECLDSVVNQKCDSFEIICINDYSQDDSLSVLKEYEEKYSCIKVFSFDEKNKGVATARNYGIRNARGKYIFFLDSDDCLIGDHCLNFMIEKMDEKRLNMLWFDGKPLFETENYKGIGRKSFYQKAYTRKKSYGYFENGYELFAEFVKNDDYSVQPSMFCTSREFIVKEKCYFPDGFFDEDSWFVFSTLLKIPRVAHYKQEIVLRRIRDNSYVTVRPNFHYIYSAYQTTKKMIEYLGKYEYLHIVEEEVSSIIDAHQACIRSWYNLLSPEEQEKIRLLSYKERYEIMNCFIKKESLVKVDNYYFPYYLFSKKDRIVLYGAGNVGKSFCRQILSNEFLELAGIVDKNAANITQTDFLVKPVDEIKEIEFDYILISIESQEVADAVRDFLIEYGVPEKKIKWCGQLYSRDNLNIAMLEFAK